MTPQLILNVDDREVNRYIRTRVLQDAGYRVIEAENGRSAVDQYRKQHPQLVLLDMNLPDLSGLEVCRSLRKLDREGRTVIVHISATSTGTGDQVAGLDNGAHAYLTDPVEPALLVATIRSLLMLTPKAPTEGETPPSRRTRLRKAAESGKAEQESGPGPYQSDYGLTSREREVLELIAAGQLTKEIAHSLGISFKTAACHRNRILAKFGARNTAEIIRRAIAAGLVRP
jgi:DNA-binding NarL/FixJ family response regulator